MRRNIPPTRIPSVDGWRTLLQIASVRGDRRLISDGRWFDREKVRSAVHGFGCQSGSEFSWTV